MSITAPKFCDLAQKKGVFLTPSKKQKPQSVKDCGFRLYIKSKFRFLRDKGVRGAEPPETGRRARQRPEFSPLPL